MCVWNDCDLAGGEGVKQLDDGIDDTFVSSVREAIKRAGGCQGRSKVDRVAATFREDSVAYVFQQMEQQRV